MPPQIENQKESKKSYAFLLTLTFLLFLTGIFGVWYYSHPLPDDLMDSNNVNNQFAGWKTYTNSQYGFEFKYPSFNTESEVKYTYPNDVSNLTLFYLDKSDNNYKESFSVDVSKNTKGSSLTQWFQDNIDDNNILVNSGSFKLLELLGGGEMYISGNNPIPTTWQGGPIQGSAYIMSPDKKYVFVFILSQDPGINIQNYISQILSTFKFISPQTNATTVDTSDWKTYTNSQYGFEFKYPVTWEFSDTGLKNTLGQEPKLKPDGTWNFSPFVVVGNPLNVGSQYYSLYVFIQTNPKKFSAIDFVKDLIKNSSKDGPMGIKYESEFSLVVNGASAYELKGLFAYTESEESVFFTNRGMAYNIQFQTADDNGNIANPKQNNMIAHQILSTFKFTK